MSMLYMEFLVFPLEKKININFIFLNLLYLGKINYKYF